MNTFIIENGDLTMNIEVNTDPDLWLIIQDEKYRPDRGAFILERFIESYPNVNVKGDVTKIYALCSRSAALGEWLAAQNLDYALIQNEPTFYRDIIDQDSYKAVSSELQENSTRGRDRANEELVAARKYKDEMDKIDKKYSKFKFKLKESRIINMNSTELPLTLQLAIENYTPSSSDSPNRRAFARELLINYKISLLTAISDDPSIDIEALIRDSYTK